MEVNKTSLTTGHCGLTWNFWVQFYISTYTKLKLTQLKFNLLTLKQLILSEKGKNRFQYNKKINLK